MTLDVKHGIKTVQNWNRQPGFLKNNSKTNSKNPHNLRLKPNRDIQNHIPHTSNTKSDITVSNSARNKMIRFRSSEFNKAETIEEESPTKYEELQSKESNDRCDKLEMEYLRSSTMSNRQHYSGYDDKFSTKKTASNFSKMRGTLDPKGTKVVHDFGVQTRMSKNLESSKSNNRT
jgi:hypothetical protein